MNKKLLAILILVAAIITILIFFEEESKAPKHNNEPRINKEIVNLDTEEYSTDNLDPEKIKVYIKDSEDKFSFITLDENNGFEAKLLDILPKDKYNRDNYNDYINVKVNTKDDKVYINAELNKDKEEILKYIKDNGYNLLKKGE